jgi:hypothetical protein
VMRIVISGMWFSSIVVCASVATAQTQGDSWKLKAFDLGAHLTHSLADAPLTSAERAQIYRVIDNQNMHDSYSDAQRDQERAMVMSTRVGSVTLAEDGSEQVVAEGPADFCGAGGQCAIWIFVRQNGQLQLALQATGATFIVRKGSSGGLHDIAMGTNFSAWDTEYNDYRWNGRKFVQADCYWTRYPRPDDVSGPGSGGQHPVIERCR